MTSPVHPSPGAMRTLALLMTLARLTAGAEVAGAAVKQLARGAMGRSTARLPRADDDGARTAAFCDCDIRAAMGAVPL